jgi:predicted N-acyltransferase
VHDSIGELDAAEWDAVVGPERLFQSHAWLRALEGGAVVDCIPKYFVVRDEAGRMLANASAYIIPTSLLIFSKGFVKKAVEAVRRLWPNFLMPRILECGCPLGPGNGISVACSAGLAAIAPLLADAFERVAREAGLRLIVLRDFIEEELGSAAALEALGYTRIPNLTTMTLDIVWNAFDDYVAAMRSRHRQKVRRGLALARRSGLQASLGTVLAINANRLARQRMNVHDFATEYSHETLAPSFYEQLSWGLGSRVRILEIGRGPETVAHALLVNDGRILRWLSFGREAGGARDGAYFLAIAKIVELAIQEQRVQVDMGMSTHGPKTDFGARMVPQWMLLRFRGPLGRLVPLALRILNPVAAAADRRIFKSGA